MPRPQLLVIRHGETEWSRTGRHTGRTDVPLTDRGREEARATSRTLDGWHVTRAYASPLSRARETADLVGVSCAVTIDDRLVEWDYGDYEGETTAQTRQRIPDWSVWTHEMTGGESVDEVGERADAFLRRVDHDIGSGDSVDDPVDDAVDDPVDDPVDDAVDDPVNDAAGNVMVVAHGHFLAIMIARWCNLPAVEGRRFALATATVSLLGWHHDDRVIRALNHRAGEVLDPPQRT